MTPQSVDYRKLFEASPLPRLVINQEKKDHFYVLTANAAAVKYFCPKTDDGCNTIDGIYVKDFMNSANSTHILQAMIVCYESRVPISVQVVPNSTKDMQVSSFLLSPVISDDGQNVMWIDMQARPPAIEQPSIERERDDALSMFTTVFDVSDVGITVTDHHGRFVRVNNRFLEQSGWDAMDLIGQELTLIIPLEDHKSAWERHHIALQSKRKSFGEVTILKKDGTLMNTMVTSMMMELSNGRSFRITTIVDITYLKEIEYDLRRAKDEADEANKAKSAFLANMSHELRTPLNAIIGFSEMMINGTLGPVNNDHYVEYLGDIKFSAQHLLQIINDVLDMSKIEAGKMPLDEEIMDMPSLLDSVKRLLLTRAEANKILVTIDAPADLPPIRGDERLIRQVFLNLLSNAVKFSRPGGEVTLKLSIDNGFRVDVIDHGIGIPDDQIAAVIEPFGQAVDPRINKGQGTGLGLPIAKAMMDMHGGTLTIHSQKDVGTTVTCLFPKNRVINHL